MKRVLVFSLLGVMILGLYTSCKKSELDRLRENEVALLDQYISKNNITVEPQASGLYYIENVEGTGDSIFSGNKVVMDFHMWGIDSSSIASNADRDGHIYEHVDFYVDVTTSAIISQNPLQQIAGLHEGLKLMREGGEASLIIPSELAFKAVYNTSLGVPRFSTLLMNVKVLKVYLPEEF